MSSVQSIRVRYMYSLLLSSAFMTRENCLKNVELYSELRELKHAGDKGRRVGRGGGEGGGAERSMDKRRREGRS